MKSVSIRGIAAGCVLASAVALAAPEIGQDVSMSQDPSSGEVTVSYTLSGAPAIVTLEILTNEAPVASCDLGPLGGDVNREVSEDGVHVIRWKPPAWWKKRVGETELTPRVTAWLPETPPQWMAVSLVDTNGYVRYYSDAASVPGGITGNVYKTEMMLFRKIPAADVRYRFGAPSGEKGRTAENGTPRIVTVSNDFYIGVYPVTQRQFELVTGERPSYFNNDVDYACRPVENVSYEVVRGAGYEWPGNSHEVGEDSFMWIMRKRTGLTGFDLPTEAEWEFAARAGCGSALYTGAELIGSTTSANLDAIARYRRNEGYVNGSTAPAQDATADNGTAEVGSGSPNDWDLYDMIGNVWEICLDFYSADPSAAELECGGPASGTTRVVRGGAWNSNAERCRCASRYYFRATTANNGLGFRVAMPLPRENPGE